MYLRRFYGYVESIAVVESYEMLCCGIVCGACDEHVGVMVMWDVYERVYKQYQWMYVTLCASNRMT